MWGELAVIAHGAAKAPVALIQKCSVYTPRGASTG